MQGLSEMAFQGTSVSHAPVPEPDKHPQEEDAG